MRKTLCYLLCTIMVSLSVCFYWSATYAEEENTYTCNHFTYRILQDGSAELLDWTNSSDEYVDRLEIPDSMDGHAVTLISQNFWPDSIGTLVLPLSVYDLPNGLAWSDNTSFEVSPDHPTLATIDGVLYEKNEKRLVRFPRGLYMENFQVPNGIKSIGKYAFQGCEIDQVYLPDTVTEIMDCAFLYSNIHKLYIAENVSSIAISAFTCTFSFEEISVSPDNPVFASIDGVLYNKQDKILFKYPDSHGADYSIPDGIKGVGDNAFFDSVISYVHFPQSCISIGKTAFSGCDNLQSIELPETLTSIDDRAFSGCPIIHFYIPETVSHIGYNPFSECMFIDVSPESNYYATIDGVLFDKIEKKLVCYPTGLEEESYVIPEGVVSIGLFSFAGSSDILHMIELPDTISTIEDEISPGVVLETLPSFAEYVVSRNSYAADYCKERGLQYRYKDANDWLNE